MLASSLRRTTVLGLGVMTLLASLILDVVALDNSSKAPLRGCGTVVAQDRVEAFEGRFLELRKRQTVTIQPRTLDVFWNVVTANETLEGGWIPQEMMNAQIEVLNQDYAEALISWRLAGFQYVHNRDWFENAGQRTEQERQMKYFFRGGDATTMNLYTIGFNSSTQILGYATMPQWFPDDPVRDGVVIRYTTMPGGTQIAYNSGRTLTHESGHWLGLYHTFQGGCGGNGDFVDDTPAEAEASQGCPVGRDTCPGAGEDPIHNFMDYSTDECLTGFTPGQIQRMHQFIENYRQPSGLNLTFPL